MMYKATKYFTELTMGFVSKLRNLVKSAELKIVLNQNHETICAPPNLKSFGAKMRNFLGSVEYLFFTVYRATG